MSNAPRRKRVKVGKHTLEVYSIGFLAAATNLANVTLRLWERKQILPKPVLNVGSGMRFYTAPEILNYASIIMEHYQASRDLRKLKARLDMQCTRIREMFRQNLDSPSLPVNVLSLHLPPKPKHLFHEDSSKEK